MRSVIGDPQHPVVLAFVANRNGKECAGMRRPRPDLQPPGSRDVGQVDRLLLARQIEELLVKRRKQLSRRAQAKRGEPAIARLQRNIVQERETGGAGLA